MELGYACINLSLKDCSPGRRTTVGYLDKLTMQQKEEKLNSLVEENLNNTLSILKFNVKNNIKIYRLSSDIIPLATHDITKNWDYINKFSDKFKQIGDFIKENKLRVSMHPGQYTVLNSNKDKVVKNSIRDLKYHSNILQAMKLDWSHKIVLHIGGVYGDKLSAIKRFKKNFKQLPLDIQKRLIIENDDKSYTATEVLKIAQELKIPMVFDVHHFNCNRAENENLKELLPDIFATWGQEKPKVHFSSPKSQQKFASHAKNINCKDFKKFIQTVNKWTNVDFNVMLECKNKDKALLKLRKELKNNCK